MCDFGIGLAASLAVYSAAASVAGTAVSYAAQADAARKQAHYQNDQYKSAAASSLASFQNQTSQTGVRVIQNEQQAAQAMQQNSIAAMTARSHALVSGMESGAEGNSLEALFNDFSRTEAQNNYTIATDKMWSTDQLQQQERQMQAEAQSRINQGKPAEVNMPSTAALALQIGTSGLGIYDTYLQRTGAYRGS